MTDKKTGFSRRTVLKGTAATAAGIMVPSFYIPNATAAGAFRNDPTGKSSVVFGLNVPQTGPYADEGAEELKGYMLAIKHINGEGDGGMMNTMKPMNLKGNGVLGKKVEYTTGDTSSNSDKARASARRMIEKDGAIMFTGGSSSGVAISVQALAQEMGIIFMAALTHSNDTTGKDRKRYGFRHLFNAQMSGAALEPVLAKEYGKDRQVYHLTVDYTWGISQQASIEEYMSKHGWKTVQSSKTPLGTADFSQYITPILNSGADVIVLNQYGKDMSNSLKQALQFGVKDKQVNGKNVEIVVPLFSRTMAQGSGDAIKGIIGTTNWHWKLQDEASKAFVKSFGQEYGYPPSMAAHTAYCQTLLYADAVERAGTFNPEQVIRALEGHEFDGMGNGKTLYRAEDHQCMKDCVIVRGNENPSSQFDLLNIEQVVPRSQLEYDHNKFPGELGPYKV